MASDDEILAAISAALDAPSVTNEDRANSRKRFLLMLKAALPLMLPDLLPEPPPPPAPLEPANPEAALLVMVAPEDDDQRRRVEELRTATLTLANEIMQLRGARFATNG